MKDPVDELLTIWKYCVPVENSKTGQTSIVIVELEPHEQADALWTWITNGLGGPGGPDGCVANLHASKYALAGLSAGWTVAAYDQIARIKALH